MADDCIKCPHCLVVYEDEGSCISYHGTEDKGSPYEVTCGDCGIDFQVHETVTRTYETSCNKRG